MLGKQILLFPTRKLFGVPKKYNLISSDVKTLDPLAGLGTIPRVINNLGGNSLGIENDAQRYNIAKEVNLPGAILHSDCLLVLPTLELVDCIFTSLPFSWFYDDSFDDKRYALAFYKILKDDGFLLLEVDEYVIRDGERYVIAEKQIAYFDDNGFNLADKITFKLKKHVDILDESLVLKFTKRN